MHSKYIALRVQYQTCQVTRILRISPALEGQQTIDRRIETIEEDYEEPHLNRKTLVVLQYANTISSMYSAKYLVPNMRSIYRPKCDKLIITWFLEQYGTYFLVFFRHMAGVRRFNELNCFR